MKKIIYYAITIIIFYVLFVFLINEIEKGECRVWFENNKIIYNWQVEQCKHHNFIK